VAPEAPLKLRAEDADDLAVISAVVQDALISVRDLTYDREGRSFTVVANRFRWEGQREANSPGANSPGANSPGAKSLGTNGSPAFERTLCAVSFGAVDGVSYRGFRRSDEDRILSLLAIRPGNKPGVIDLDFSGDVAVRLTVSAINCRAADVGEPWPTAWQPDHASDPPGDES
jgi:hypothetical protein